MSFEELFSEEDEYRLSVLELNNQGECDVVHYKIDRDSKGCYTIKADTGFTTVLGLVNYYKGIKQMQTP